ncbi:EAL domain-containing protein [Azospirillum sp. SYSU D00513]|uniref:EAL domain-containing protein n=1 Tax=Azospirillum sp. SYSU D00513 TaxID=2812561 RepID=UPI001A963065|nr:EAL domain-containing protein [Azospirillum sp. SYSU D00513]
MREAPSQTPADPHDRVAAAARPVRDGAPVGLLFLDRDLRCTHLNGRMTELTGLPRAAHFGRTPAELLPGAGDGLAMALRRAADGEEVGGVELRRPDGRGLLKVCLRSLAGEGEGAGGLLCTVAETDWDARTADEASLRASEDHYRHTVELSPFLFWNCDADGLSLEFSPRWRERMGLSYEEAVGNGWLRAVHPDDRERIARAWDNTLRTGARFDHQARFKVAEGGYRWFRCRAMPRHDAEGRIVGWYGSDADIHDWKVAEAALRESEDHYRHSVELNPQYPFIMDPDGALLDISPRWQDLVGLTREETLGHGWMRAVHPEDAESTRRNWEEALRTGRRMDHEKRLRMADGSYRWFRGRATARLGADGRIIRWYGSTEDIHDRKLTEAALRDSEAFARQILDTNPECMKVLDLDGRLLFMSPPGQRLLEVEDFSRIEGIFWPDIWPEESRARASAAIDEARAGGIGHFIDFCPTLAGTPKWWDNLIRPIPGPDGRAARLLAISRDITDAHMTRRALEDSAKRLSAVLESTTDGVLFVGRDWRVTYANRRAAELHGAERIDFGGSLFDLFPDAPGMESVPVLDSGCACAFGRRFRQAMEEEAPVAFEGHLNARNVWVEIHAFPTPEGLSVFFRDVTERRRAKEERRLAQEKIARIARYDALTGLPNRLSFQERLERELADAAGRAGLAVHYLDLDQFKTVNDTLGHPAGDALLKQVAARLRHCVRDADLVSRFGGDEFAVVQTGLRQPDDAASLARRIVESLGEPYEVDGAQIMIGTSVGVALGRSDGAGADALMKAADIALYRAKAAGRGTHRFFAPWMAEQLHAYHALKLGLREALAKGQFELHYQPLVDLRSGGISGFEALLRWRHPERGLVSPAEFIPVAEETGLIVAIGEWVLQEACREAAGWPGTAGVSVNLSSVQFRSRGLVEAVAGALAESGLEPGRLELEITESVLLQDNDANLAVLSQLRQLGLRIAMDDFGTGYSALGYLRSFPFDKIKIDRSFVSDLPQCGGSKAILGAVAGLGRDLAITTTAEGVETHAQLEAVRAQGCDEAQGYFFSRPVPASAIPDLLARLPNPAAGAVPA